VPAQLRGPMRAVPDPNRALRVNAAAVVWCDGTPRERGKPLAGRTELVQAGVAGQARDRQPFPRANIQYCDGNQKINRCTRAGWGEREWLKRGRAN
jgi:hypothetical protein